MKHQWLFLSLVGIFGGYLVFGFFSDDSPRERQASTSADLNSSIYPSRYKNAPSRTSAKQSVQASHRYPSVTSGPLGVNEAIELEHEAEVLSLEEEDMIVEAEVQEAILAELERLEREHGVGDDQDAVAHDESEMSDPEERDLRLDLEADIEDEMTELEYAADNPGWKNVDLIPDYGPDGIWRESDGEESQLALEAAIEEEMANLENEYPD